MSDLERDIDNGMDHGNPSEIELQEIAEAMAALHFADLQFERGWDTVAELEQIQTHMDIRWQELATKYNNFPTVRARILALREAVKKAGKTITQYGNFGTILETMHSIPFQAFQPEQSQLLLTAINIARNPRAGERAPNTEEVRHLLGEVGLSADDIKRRLLDPRDMSSATIMAGILSGDIHGEPRYIPPVTIMTGVLNGDIHVEPQVGTQRRLLLRRVISAGRRVLRT